VKRVRFFTYSKPNEKGSCRYRESNNILEALGIAVQFGSDSTIHMKVEITKKNGDYSSTVPFSFTYEEGLVGDKLYEHLNDLLDTRPRCSNSLFDDWSE